MPLHIVAWRYSQSSITDDIKTINTAYINLINEVRYQKRYGRHKGWISLSARYDHARVAMTRTSTIQLERRDRRKLFALKLTTAAAPPIQPCRYRHCYYATPCPRSVSTSLRQNNNSNRWYIQPVRSCLLNEISLAKDYVKLIRGIYNTMDRTNIFKQTYWWKVDNRKRSSWG